MKSRRGEARWGAFHLRALIGRGAARCGRRWFLAVHLPCVRLQVFAGRWRWAERGVRPGDPRGKQAALEIYREGGRAGVCERSGRSGCLAWPREASGLDLGREPDPGSGHGSRALEWSGLRWPEPGPSSWEDPGCH